jgi:hypothetical protein
LICNRRDAENSKRLLTVRSIIIIPLKNRDFHPIFDKN